MQIEYTADQLYGPWFCPLKVDHISRPADDISDSSLVTTVEIMPIF